MKQKRKQLPEKQKPANGKLLQWHPAFYADLQIEFREETEKLKFEREYLLSSKPMAIDVLIIHCPFGGRRRVLYHPHKSSTASLFRHDVQTDSKYGRHKNRRK